MKDAIDSIAGFLSLPTEAQEIVEKDQGSIHLKASKVALLKIAFGEGEPCPAISAVQGKRQAKHKAVFDYEIQTRVPKLTDLVAAVKAARCTEEGDAWHTAFDGETLGEMQD